PRSGPGSLGESAGSFLALPPCMAGRERAGPRTQGRPSAAQRSASQYQVKRHVTVTSDQDDLNQSLSKALNREVTLRAAQRRAVHAEEYWPDMEGLDHRDTVTDFTLPEESFFDGAMVHLLTTATLDRLCGVYPEG